MSANDKRVLLLGSSHLRALKYADLTMAKKRDFVFRRLNLTAKEFNGWCHWSDNELVVPDWVVDKISSECVNFAPDMLVLSIGGSEYFVYSAISPVRDFDFFLPEQLCDTPLEANEIVPYELIRNLLRKHMSHVDKMLQICSRMNIKLAYLDTPPPNPSDDAFRARLPDFLVEQAKERGLGRSELRRKMWLVQRSINEELCLRHGATLLPVPAEAITPNGMMREDLRYDAFHASAAYGDLVLDQINALLKRAS